MSPWQPIETAPKDGTPILVWADPFIEHVAWSWLNGLENHGWWTIWGNGHAVDSSDYAEGRDCYFDENVATHWMPLPDPPKLEDGQT